MPPEGVVHALRALHEALVPGGRVVDTQPVSARPPVGTERGVSGVLDMRGWIDIVEAVDRRLEEALAEGLFLLEEERRFVVEDRFADGPELLAASAEWRGCRIPGELEDSLAADASSAWLRQEVRLRVLRSAG